MYVEYFSYAKFSGVWKESNKEKTLILPLLFRVISEKVAFSRIPLTDFLLCLLGQNSITCLYLYHLLLWNLNYNHEWLSWLNFFLVYPMPEQNWGYVNNKTGEGERNSCQVYLICLKKKHRFYRILHSSLYASWQWQTCVSVTWENYHLLIGRFFIAGF